MGKYPNDVHFPMTMDEVDETSDRAHELLEAGDVDGYNRLLNSIPVLPCVAKIMKRELGLPFLAERRVNLYEAIQEFGEEFVEQ